MSSLLKASRVESSEARLLTATRFDTVLSYFEPESLPELDLGEAELVNRQLMADLISVAES